ncbi:MAG: MBL fold metallo-hydrolase [Chloroflexi bacterium]|nr:MBL fold metallo-hydrolase [Chloroflexota bacterium]
MIFKAMPLGPYAVNVYFVGSEETKEVMIVDPGAEANAIVEEVKRQGWKVTLMVSTHGHGDHTGAGAALKEALEAPYGLHSNDAHFLSDESPVREVLPDYLPPSQVDMPLKGGDQIKLGELTFLVLETPGHSTGSICIYGHGLVFTGDTLFQGSVGVSHPPHGSHAILINSILTKLMILPDETLVLPGHGAHSTIGIEKRTNPFLGGRRRALW